MAELHVHLEHYQICNLDGVVRYFLNVNFMNIMNITYITTTYTHPPANSCRTNSDISYPYQPRTTANNI